MTGRLAVVVRAKETAAEGVVTLELAAADGALLPPWSPGAHVDVHLPGGLVRQYSLCGNPGDRSAYRIGVLREPDGRGGSMVLHEAVSVGLELSIDGPRNNFPLVDASSYLFIAGGIGITPILPMLTAVAEGQAPWRLVYGGRRRASMAFLSPLAEHGGQVEVRPQDETGLLELDAILDGLDAACAVYCCGPEPLIQAVEACCPPGQLHVERFAARAVAGAETQFEVELAQSHRSVLVPGGTSVLHALEAAGLSVLSSCQEGTCGTCETGVLAGVPDHRDSVLTAAEQAVGDVMMICVSRARTPRLVLDL
jgi:ferredoxin-NADP reductase